MAGRPYHPPLLLTFFFCLETALLNLLALYFLSCLTLPRIFFFQFIFVSSTSLSLVSFVWPGPRYVSTFPLFPWLLYSGSISSFSSYFTIGLFFLLLLTRPRSLVWYALKRSLCDFSIRVLASSLHILLRCWPSQCVRFFSFWVGELP